MKQSNSHAETCWDTRAEVHDEVSDESLGVDGSGLVAEFDTSQSTDETGEERKDE